MVHATHGGMNVHEMLDIGKEAAAWEWGARRQVVATRNTFSIFPFGVLPGMKL